MNRFPSESPTDAWTPAKGAGYRDPVRSEEERSEIAARLAKNQAALRRAKLAERWIVYTIASMLAITMFPVLIAIAAIAAAVTVWRRVSRSLWRRENVAGAESGVTEAALEQRASVRAVEAGIHVPRRRPTIDVRQRKARPPAGKPANEWCREQSMEGV